MEKGQKVTVYYDPFRRELPEGEAILLEKLIEHPGEMEYWEVQFEDREIYKRWIALV